jgi:Xaa-Pro aminopeptidase
MVETLWNGRLGRIRGRMRAYGVDLLLLTRPSAVTYVTGFMGQDSWAVLTARQVLLLTDSRYLQQAEKECPTARIIERRSAITAAAAAAAGQAGVSTMAVDPSISLADWNAVRRQVRIRVKTMPDPVAEVRKVKDPAEIHCIQKAGSIARRALTLALADLRPGVTENAMAGLLDYHFRRLGGVPAFDTIVAFGSNASRPHHRPTSRRLRSRDTVLIDFGARYRGYCSDITRSFAVGEPPPLFLKAFEAVRRAQQSAIRAIEPGATLAEVDAAARRVIQEAGLPVYGHGTGHGIGLDIHEGPFLRPGAHDVLEAGMVLTVEPAVYLPGRYGVRLEDDVLVTTEGCRILTAGRRCGLRPWEPTPA